MAKASGKEPLKAELVRLLTAELETMTRALDAVREAATHEEAKPENDKDTRALEQSYLAHGQSLRVEELRSGLAEVMRLELRAFGDAAPVALGALVVSAEDGEEKRFFVAPYGGGTSLAKGEVQVVTPKSPLGRALLGKRVGDECELDLGGRKREIEIVRVD